MRGGHGPKRSPVDSRPGDSTLADDRLATQARRLTIPPTALPKTPVKDIVSALAAQGIKISGNYVYMLKSKMKAKRRVEKRQKGMAVTAGAEIASPLDLIREVKQLAARAGGLRALKELVDVLAE
jgi:hypothetical protein